MACHGEGACAQALPEPRRDYLARLPGGRKTPQQPAGGVEEVAPQWCGTQPTVKDRSTNSGAQRPTRGVGARLPPRCPPATGTTSHGCSGPYTRIPIWWESGCRVAPPGCAVTEQRCAWHPRMPSRHTLPRWHLLGRPWRAAHAICCGVHVLGTMADTSRPTVRARPRRGPTSARGLALTQEPSGMTWRSRARKEKSPKRDRRRPRRLQEQAGAAQPLTSRNAAISGASSRGGRGVTGSYSTGRVQRSRCFPLCPSGGDEVRQGAAPGRARCRADGGSAHRLATQRKAGAASRAVSV